MESSFRRCTEGMPPRTPVQQWTTPRGTNGTCSSFITRHSLHIYGLMRPRITEFRGDRLKVKHSSKECNPGLGGGLYHRTSLRIPPARHAAKAIRVSETFSSSHRVRSRYSRTEQSAVDPHEHHKCAFVARFHRHRNRQDRENGLPETKRHGQLAVPRTRISTRVRDQGQTNASYAPENSTKSLSSTKPSPFISAGQPDAMDGSVQSKVS